MDKKKAGTRASNRGVPAKSRYLNRELSWLNFARRVLAMVEDGDVPLMERVKFAGIMGMLHDEFFMKRISGMKRNLEKGRDKRSIDGLRPLDELIAFQLAEADIKAQCTDERWRRFMQFQIERARRLYAESLPGMAMLNRQGRPAVAAAAEFYQAILDDIEAHDYDVFTRRAHVSDRDKLFRIPAIWWRASVGHYQE